LTFWLSNTVVLREIIAQTFGTSQHSSPVKVFSSNGNANKPDRSFTSSQWKSNYNGKYVNPNIMQLPDDWQKTSTLLDALEKIESWIFSRIVESVWWQVKSSPYYCLSIFQKAGYGFCKTVMVKTYCRLIHVFSFLKGFFISQAMTPHMQTPVEDLSTPKIGRLLGQSLGDQQHGSFSIDLWRSAFQDAFSRICPLRAGGHECGCLPVLAKLVCFQMLIFVSLVMVSFM
jgi:hypothetical protein